jgi:trehalose utilization protein
MGNKIQTAVLVENHPYNIAAFQKMLDSFADLQCFVQPIDLFVQDEISRDHYDVVLWYNMNWNIPQEGSVLRNYMEKSFGENKQGVLFLHHALLSFQGWDLFTDICGVRNRGGDTFQYHQNQPVSCVISDHAHPITQGMADFSICDETYSIGEPEEPGNQILITTDNSTSVHKLAWTRQYKNSRIFSYLSGHDEKVYDDEEFRQVLHRGLVWAADAL